MKLSTIPVLMRNPHLVLRAMKRRLRLPSYYSDFGFVRKSMPAVYCQSLAGQSSYKQIYPENKAQYKLPENISSGDDLSKAIPERLSLSFYDVPTLNVSETFIGYIPDCKIVCCPNEWGRESYSIFGADNIVIQIKGTEFRSAHRKIIRSACSGMIIPEATWVLTRFYGAYFRWFTQVLPHIVFASEQGWSDTFLWPPDRAIKPYMRDSLKMLGLSPDGYRIDLGTPLINCDRMNIIESDTFCGPLLKKMRQSIMVNIVSRPSKRRVYISRSKARWRHCANEAKVWTLLKDAGYERYCMEDLKFYDQVMLMSEASVIVSLHGAGLTNMIFCQKGTHVVEIVDPGRPNPHYYALSSCLDHVYWYLEGNPVDAQADPVYRDLSVDVSKLKSVVERVALQLA